VRTWNALYPRHEITDLKEVKIHDGGWSERIQVGCGAMSLVSGF
jgi:hypothetical protein